MERRPALSVSDGDRAGALVRGGTGLEDRTAIAVAVLVGLLDGAALGYLVARRAVGWFARRKPWTARAWLLGLVVLTLMSFPGLFRFSISRVPAA